jgi:alpha-1,3-rhamnosyl/mannosyltransferase
MPTGTPSCNVIFNDRPLRTPRTGVGHYLLELLRWLPRVRPDQERVAFHFDTLLRRGVSFDERMPEAGAPIQGRRWPWWMRQGLSQAYETLFYAMTPTRGNTVYHEPNHIPMRWHGPTVTTIHDLSVIRHPEWHPADRVHWYRREFDRGLSQSSHFIAVSQFTKREMVDVLGVSADRISVIYNGVRAEFKPKTRDRIGPTLSRFGIEKEYLLFVGTLEPRKNLERLLRAFAALPAAARKRFDLVIAGGVGWGEVHALAKSSAESVRLTGYLTDADLADLYAGARALVWPSLYEGFGLPPLECMACGRPALVGAVASLPEVVGDAGWLVDPLDVDSIRTGLSRLIEDDALVERLAGRCLERAGRFTWERSAREHAEVYDRFAG